MPLRPTAIGLASALAGLLSLVPFGQAASAPASGAATGPAIGPETSAPAAPPVSGQDHPDTWRTSATLTIAISRPVRDPAGDHWVVAVRLHNSGPRPVAGPVRLVFAGSPAATGVLRPDGLTADGQPYLTLPLTAPLPPGATSDPLRVALTQPGVRFLRRQGPIIAQERTTTPVSQSAPEPATAPVPDGGFVLQLLHVSDIDSTSPLAALANVQRFSALLNHFRADPMLGPNSLTVSSGDNWITAPRFNAANDPRMGALLGLHGFGRGDVAMLNAMGFVASTLGNHELDRGPAEFAAVITPEHGDDGRQWPGAAFPYLSANLDFRADPTTRPLVTTDGQPAADIPGRLAGFATVSMGGETIGLVGAITPTLPSISDPGGIGVRPADPADLDALAASLQPAVDALTAAGVNKIILLAHMQQIAVEEALAARLRGVDIIVAGGSNTRLFDADDQVRPGDTVQGPYPLRLTGADGAPVLLVNTDGDYKYLGRLVVYFDADGVLDPERLDPAVSGAWASTDERLTALGITLDAADPKLRAIAGGLLALVQEKDGRQVGRTAVYLDGARDTVRRRESNFANLTADAGLWLARQADPTVRVALKNGGGIRAPVGLIYYPPGATDPAAGRPQPPADGRISQLDIEGALAFNNGLTLVTLTAARLRAVLEHGVAASTPTNTPGQFPQVAGLRFSWDRRLPAGARLRNLALVDEQGTVTDVLMRDGDLQGDPARPIRAVASRFLVDGGDGYPFPGFGDLARVELTRPDDAPRTGRFTFAADGSEQDALAEYLGEFFRDRPYDRPQPAALEATRIQDLATPGRVDTVLAGWE